MQKVLKLKPLRSAFHSASSLACSMSTFVEKVIEVEGQPINFLKTGNGPHAVFCLPGAVGTIWSDFKPQIEKLNKDKFTLFVWDPPGYGKSRPPNKTFDRNVYRSDAKFASLLLQRLEINNCSLLGWSDGGITALILAAAFPEKVNKVAVWGVNTYISEVDLKINEGFQNLSNWSDKMKAPLVQLYGLESLQSMMNSWYKAMEEIFKEGGDICAKDLTKIRSRVLILHGDKDPLIPQEHPEFLLRNLQSASIYRFPDGKHNIHLRYADEFNGEIEKFLES